jgi:predicted phage baseplate assembly protein
VAWLATTIAEEYSATSVRPELVLCEISPDGASGTKQPWQYVRWLLDAGPAQQVFTLTPEQYSPVLTSGGATWLDYDGDGGTTIRFGGGGFGGVPLPGTTFEVLYRVGGGTVGNVPADTIVSVVPGQSQGALVEACTNPFAATGGADGETNIQVRDRAPQRFRAELLRAVQPRDYEAAAQSLSWVQQAGTTFRWTGSWLTVLTSADPVGSEQPSVAEFESLTALLDRRRLAGYESHVVGPRYFSLDLFIEVVGLPAAFASDVERAVLTRLAPGTLPDGTTGFFDHSQWGFGEPLESSALLAAIQSCAGVQGVSSLRCRRRGVDVSLVPLSETLLVAPDQIIRVDNDLSRPEAGSLRVTVLGSK